MSGLDDLINCTLDSLQDSEKRASKAPEVSNEPNAALQKLLETVGSSSDAGNEELRDVLNGLNLGDLLDGIEESDFDDLITQAEAMLGGDASAPEDPEKLADLLNKISSSDISDEDKRILREVQTMVSDLDSGKADEASVVARAFDLIAKLKSSE